MAIGCATAAPRTARYCRFCVLGAGADGHLREIFGSCPGLLCSGFRTLGGMNQESLGTLRRWVDPGLSRAGDGRVVVSALVAGVLADLAVRSGGGLSAAILVFAVAGALLMAGRPAGWQSRSSDRRSRGLRRLSRRSVESVAGATRCVGDRWPAGARRVTGPQRIDVRSAGERPVGPGRACGRPWGGSAGLCSAGAALGSVALGSGAEDVGGASGSRPGDPAACRAGCAAGVVGRALRAHLRLRSRCRRDDRPPRADRPRRLGDGRVAAGGGCRSAGVRPAAVSAAWLAGGDDRPGFGHRALRRLRRHAGRGAGRRRATRGRDGRTDLCRVRPVGVLPAGGGSRHRPRCPADGRRLHRLIVRPYRAAGSFSCPKWSSP